VADEVEENDFFGASLAAGDFNNDSMADLVVGAPSDSIDGEFFIQLAGAVHVFYGSATGPQTAGSQFFHLDTPGIPGQAEIGHAFGKALAIVDFNDDGLVDLAIGAPFDDTATVQGAGTVIVIYASEGGLSASGSQRFHQNSFGVPGGAEYGDLFGWTLTGTGTFDQPIFFP
jgi:hypothetical protein